MLVDTPALIYTTVCTLYIDILPTNAHNYVYVFSVNLYNYMTILDQLTEIFQLSSHLCNSVLFTLVARMYFYYVSE